ncbi:hypothetical protein [Allorhizocola rhizosphaerae]|uniref:hypothetical protein n=1 Tax=Allorhizocola rhizosphaerae TaxID=1872709 RepID=UPI001FECBB77|nr:hypothetical protein [Allorhizocola rhizosphaerae]
MRSQRDAGRLDLARDYVLQARCPAQETANSHLLARTGYVMGTVLARLGEYQQALDAHREAHRHACDAGMRMAEVEALIGLATPTGAWPTRGRARDCLGGARYGPPRRVPHP